MRRVEFPPSVPGFLRHVAERHSDTDLVVLNGRRFSYAEVERRSAEWARGLLASGVGKGTRVGLLFPNGPDWVLGWLAATRIGALVVPINTFLKTRELGWLLRHADVDTLLTQALFLNQDYVSRLEEIAPALEQARAGALHLQELPYLRRVLIWGEATPAWAGAGGSELSERAGEVDDALLREVEACVTPADAMVVIYSSGSTAEPKGALHTHGAILRHAHNLNAFRDVVAGDRIYTPMPFFWVGGFAFGLVSAMLVGATLVCEDVFEPGRTLELMERERVSVVAAWPHHAKALAEHPDLRTRDLSAVRTGTLHALLPRDQRPADPELRSNALGMTETAGPHSIDRMDVDLPESLRSSFGHAPPGLEHRIVDPETGAELAPGESGEICVRGYSLMQGLYKREREDTFEADGFYRTGDGGRLDADGVLFFEGRLGELIKTGGANVTPREVEVALEALGEVKEAYVVGLPHPDRGETVEAAVVLQAGRHAEPDALRARLKQDLAAYKVPRHVLVCGHDELPFTDSGKIDKRGLIAFLTERLSRES